MSWVFGSNTLSIKTDHTEENLTSLVETQLKGVARVVMEANFNFNNEEDLDEEVNKYSSTYGDNASQLISDKLIGEDVFFDAEEEEIVKGLTDLVSIDGSTINVEWGSEDDYLYAGEFLETALAYLSTDPFSVGIGTLDCQQTGRSAWNYYVDREGNTVEKEDLKRLVAA